MHRILIVDDEPFNLDILRIFLRSLQYEVIEATCGLAALKMVDEWDIDLILLDMMMPDISGEEVCKILHQRNGFRTPIIFLSAKVGSDDVLRGLQAGAIDYLPKPIDLDLLQLKVSRAIKEYEAYKLLEHENQNLVQLAHYDGLTQLLNRNHLNIISETSEQLYNGSMMIDVVNFKRINDTYGHVLGDRALVQISNVLLDKTNGFVERTAYRFGGDEFLILFNENSTESVIESAKEIYSDLSNISFQITEQDVIQISVRAGIYAGTTSQSILKLMERADEALVETKALESCPLIIHTSEPAWR